MNLEKYWKVVKIIIMEKDAIKEALNNHRLNKTILWNSFLLLTGGIIGLVFRIISNRGLLEIILAVVGIIIWFILIYLIGVVNQEINKLWLLLKK